MSLSGTPTPKNAEQRFMKAHNSGYHNCHHKQKISTYIRVIILNKKELFSIKAIIHLEGLKREAYYLKPGNMGELIVWAQVILNLCLDMLSLKPLWNIFIVGT